MMMMISIIVIMKVVEYATIASVFLLMNVTQLDDDDDLIVMA